eukprot:GEZU01029399.1.p1 GENE.GEZU01029399.1~~GEZU01029399.1.p1  ORF type:complete len:101 (-),score=19.13 GEZU01029399.1:209-511(-)
MGGGGRFPYPKDVWSPAGGWWSNPRHWKRNTVIATVGMLALAVPVFMLSARLERRPMAPWRPAPSQRWSYYTKEDDPQYEEKVKEWAEKKNAPKADKLHH